MERVWDSVMLDCMFFLFNDMLLMLWIWNCWNFRTGKVTWLSETNDTVVFRIILICRCWVTLLVTRCIHSIYTLYWEKYNDKSVRSFLVSVAALAVMFNKSLSKAVDSQLLALTSKLIIHQTAAPPKIPAALQRNPHLIHSFINRTFICFPHINTGWQNSIHSLSGIEIRYNVYITTLNWRWIT